MLEYNKYPDLDLLEQASILENSLKFAPSLLRNLIEFSTKGSEVRETQDYKDALAYLHKNVSKILLASQKIMEALKKEIATEL
jgi:hypothetical protein